MIRAIMAGSVLAVGLLFAIQPAKATWVCGPDECVWVHEHVTEVVPSFAVTWAPNGAQSACDDGAVIRSRSRMRCCGPILKPVSVPARRLIVLSRRRRVSAARRAVIGRLIPFASGALNNRGPRSAVRFRTTRAREPSSTSCLICLPPFPRTRARAKQEKANAELSQ